MDKNQDTELTNFLRDKAKEAERAIGYRASYFLGMLESEGGYRTALRLLSAKDISDGFKKLWLGRRLDLSVEALVVESKWRSAFPPELVTLAEKRLKAAEYLFVRWSGEEDQSAVSPSATAADQSQRIAGANRIVVPWPGGDEHIDIDLDTLSEESAIYLTKQTYPDNRKADIFVASSNVRMSPDGSYVITIRYDRAANPHIAESWWGTSVIRVRPGETSALASWNDVDDESNNGEFECRLEYAPEAEGTLQWIADDHALEARTDLGDTVKQVLRNERRGQHVFREGVLQIEGTCRLTGVDDPNHLRASHIKPWAESSSFERLDPNNGLMLAPHVDHLFDRRFISFDDKGNLLVLNDKIHSLLKRWGIDPAKVAATRTPFNARQLQYLKHHRERFLSLQAS